MSRAYRDPEHALNDDSYLTGKECVERGCHNTAGTYWSPNWCQPCNAKRMDRVSTGLKEAVARLTDNQQETDNAPR